MPDHHIQHLLQLRKHLPSESSPTWHIRMIQPELNGGKVTQDQIASLAEQATASTLTISGLDQQRFEFLCDRFAQQFTAIHFWKCPRIADLSALENMPQLRYVAFYWNQRATRLWNFQKTPALRGLHFGDFTKLEDLKDLSSATSLEELCFGNAIWTKLGVPSLEPLCSLSSLRTLAFNAKAVLDQRIQPLAQLSQLTELSFPSNLFTTTQLAWLRAHLPYTVQAEMLTPYRQLTQAIVSKGKKLDVLVSGKGKPFLSSETDAARLSRYVVEFNALVNRFSSDMLLDP